MKVLQTIEKGRKIITITVPQGEEIIVQKNNSQVVVKHKITLEEASAEVRKYLKRIPSDKEINQLVKKVRKELWGNE